MMFRDHRQVFPVVIVTVVRRCRSVAPSPEYTASGDYRSSAAGGSAKGPSSRLTVAVVFQGPEQFRAKSVRGPLLRSWTYGSFRAKVHEDHL